MINQELDWIASQRDEMIQTLQSWSNINSGSYNVDGINKVAKTIATYAQQLTGCEAGITPLTPISIIDDNGLAQEKAIGPVLSIVKQAKPKRNSDDHAAPVRILFCGHMDTVFDISNSFQSCTMIDSNTLGGPGVADMKGGILVMLNAIQAIEKSALADKIDWQILLNSDEEIGSPGSASYLAQAALKADVGMVFEPSMPDGYLAGARKGSANYSLVVHGKAAHAGREYHLGRNAIAALSSAMTRLDSLNGRAQGITLNLGRIVGGGPNNVVADLAICHFNIRVTDTDEQLLAEKHVQKTMAQLNSLEGISAEITGGFGRPPKPANVAQQKLFDLVQHCGDTLELPLGFRSTGGCCDGNNLLAAGLPNIDTLGVQGGDIHSADEYMLLDSLVERTQLTALMLAHLATDPIKWIQSKS